MRGTSPASSFSVLPSISLRHSPTLFTLRSLSSTSPLDGVVMPSAFLTLGLRKSISTKITRAPFLLSASARFVETVVLPSPGIVLVTSIAWHLPLSSRRKSFILRLRMLSWKEPDTRLFNIESVFTLCCLRFLNVTLGRVARQVWFSFMRISSGSRTVFLIAAQSIRKTKPIISPTIAPFMNVFTGLKLLYGTVGSTGSVKRFIVVLPIT